MGLAGLLWVWLRSIPIASRFDIAALALGILAAAIVLGGEPRSLWLFPAPRTTSRVHAFLDHEFVSAFRGSVDLELLLLALLAGFGEEIFFRGVLQQETGIWVASLIFGVLHGPSKDFWPLALWAAVMGALLGFLYESTGNLVVPAVAHAVYDGVALVYVRNKFRRYQMMKFAKTQALGNDFLLVEAREVAESMAREDSGPCDVPSPAWGSEPMGSSSFKKSRKHLASR